MSVNAGVANGTRVIKEHTLNSSGDPVNHAIPCTNTSSAQKKSIHPFTHGQFPLEPAFAVAIKKSRDSPLTSWSLFTRPLLSH